MMQSLRSLPLLSRVWVRVVTALFVSAALVDWKAPYYSAALFAIAASFNICVLLGIEYCIASRHKESNHDLSMRVAVILLAVLTARIVILGVPQIKIVRTLISSVVVALSWGLMIETVCCVPHSKSRQRLPRS